MDLKCTFPLLFAYYTDRLFYFMTNKNWTKLLAVVVALSLGMTAVAAMPWQFYFTQPGNEDIEFPGMNNETVAEMQQMYEQVRAAIEAGNYTQWKAAMEGFLTEERFQMHVDFHNAQQEKAQLMEQLRTAWEEGDYDTIAQLRGQMENSSIMPAPTGKGEGLGKNLNHTPPGLEHSQGNAWGRLKQAFGKLKFWGKG